MAPGASIQEMSDTLLDMGDNVHIVTYWRQICRKMEHIYDQLLGAPCAALHPLSESPTSAGIKH